MPQIFKPGGACWMIVVRPPPLSLSLRFCRVPDGTERWYQSNSFSRILMNNLWCNAATSNTFSNDIQSLFDSYIVNFTLLFASVDKVSSAGPQFCLAAHNITAVPSSGLRVKVATGGDPVFPLKVVLQGEQVLGSGNANETFLSALWLIFSYILFISQGLDMLNFPCENYRCLLEWWLPLWLTFWLHATGFFFLVSFSRWFLPSLYVADGAWTPG